MTWRPASVWGNTKASRKARARSAWGTATRTASTMTLDDAGLVFGPGAADALNFVLTGTGTLAGNVPAAVSIEVTGDAGGDTTISAGATFSNFGDLVIASAASGSASILSLSTSTLVNETDGTIELSPGAGGVSRLLAELDNKGDLAISTNAAHGARLGRAGAAHTTWW
jgi:hypothetical protein